MLIFEIETLCRLFTSKLEFFDPISKKELKNYFESRLPYYKFSLSTSPYLTELVERAGKQFNFNPNFYGLPTLKSGKNDSSQPCFLKVNIK